jgi:hypothetical protein
VLVGLGQLHPGGPGFGRQPGGPALGQRQLGRQLGPRGVRLGQRGRPLPQQGDGPLVLGRPGRRHLDVRLGHLDLALGLDGLVLHPPPVGRVEPGEHLPRDHAVVLPHEQLDPGRQDGAVLPPGRRQQLEPAGHPEGGRHPPPLDLGERDAQVPPDALGQVDAVRDGRRGWGDSGGGRRVVVPRRRVAAVLAAGRERGE